ncbi:hypothetical protein JHL18_08095 [Clostridium sp. YIM B02505]|uniref:Uncharacterized protein n=1 Tax=Clostridium yunnanense TaxID=2800325 RepID=A0ABS1EML0_9CLOT|nr:hypothetical protein [Clostridium yunnanense]MBK1810596.1 hypothetical protein [Clostridium yunnanense]
MTIIVFSGNEEGVSVELTTEKLDKALEKYKENIEEYFLEIWIEDDVKLGEVVFDYQSEEEDAKKCFYFLDEENEEQFSSLEDVKKYILERIKA